MDSRRSNSAEGVNGALQQSQQGDSSGRGGSRASQVVNLQNPCGESLRIGTWNVRSMLRPEKLENIKREMSKNNINMLGMTEVRWKKTGDTNSDSYRVIHSGGDQSQRGVALILDRTSGQAVSEVECMSDRLMRVRLSGTPVDIVVIVVYMPTTDYEDEDVEEIYEQMEEAVKKGRGDDYVIILGDLNAVVGNQGEAPVAGKHGLGNRNERGQMLIEFCKRNKLCLTNTWFKQNKRRTYTWKAPGDLRRRQLDYILVKQRYRNSVKNSHACPGADANTDHSLVVMRAKLKLKRLKKPTRRKKWNLEALKGDKKQKLSDGVKLRLQESQTTENNINNNWNTLKEAITKSAEEHIGKEKRRRAKKPWVSEAMLNKMDERRKWKKVNNEEGRMMYRRLNNELRRETDNAREKYWNDQCKELEELDRSGKMDKMYGKVKDLTWKKKAESTKSIMSKEGVLLKEAEEVNERWKEYIEELYNKEDKPSELELENETDVNRDERGPSILRSEVLQAIKDLKTGKAEGEDEIPAELIKALSDEGEKYLIKLCQEMFNTGEWPEDFKKSTIVPLQKKPNAQRCEDHRTISLIAHASKIMLKILNNRMRARTNDFIGWDQFGFRKGIGTREAIAVLRTMGERCIEHDQKLYICFVDYEKAFDRVDWKRLMEILKRLGVDWKERRLITGLYMGQTATVRTASGMAGPCTIGRGVRQGCLLSPLLFNIYAEAMMKEAMDEIEEGVKFGGHQIQAVRFADDQAMTASTKEGLQIIMDKLNEVVESFKMRINKSKTKVMMIGRGEPEQLRIDIGGTVLEQVHQFKYLGSLMTEDGKSEREVRTRVALTKDAFTRHEKLLTGNISQNLKKRLIKTLVWSVLLYGSESWTLKKTEIKRLESCEMWIWRRMERVSWRDRVRNEEVLRRAGEERTLIRTIWKRKMRWIGHIMRGDGMLRVTIEGRVEGKRPRGRKRRMMLDDILDERKYHEKKKIAQERERWRRLSCTVPVLGQPT